MPHQQQNPLSDSLNYEQKPCKEDQESNNNNKNDQFLILENDELTTLFSNQENQYKILCFNNLVPADYRGEAVDWILNVVEHYSFSALTALLAVNYLDRFLFSLQFQSEKPWMIQLAAVTCLSLAAKFEETHVPLLLDLQVEESKYMFEAKTIQRMEMLVLSNLEWKMNPVTPLSFIDYTIRRLGLKDQFGFQFIKKCECLLLSIIADCRSMCYLPSIIATVTMLYVINSKDSCIGIECHSKILNILGIKKDKVEDCCKLIQELTSRGFGQCRSNKRKFGSSPGSPNTVMDLSFCSGTSIDSSASVSSSPEPFSKKCRGDDE